MVRWTRALDSKVHAMSEEHVAHGPDQDAHEGEVGFHRALPEELVQGATHELSAELAEHTADSNAHLTQGAVGARDFIAKHVVDLCLGNRA